MKKNILKYLALLLISVIIPLGAVVPMQMGEATNSRWMAELADEASLNSLTLPGTHDSGAIYSIADLSGKCQSLPIREQLKIGVRFFDVRLQLVNNELNVVHSFVDQMTAFKDVLADMAAFIRDNGSEFLLVSIKEDASPKDSDKSFTAVLEELLRSYPEVSGERVLPDTVGDARGGIHILARYRDASIGLPCHVGWSDDATFELDGIYVQDNYCVADTDEKIADIRSTYSVALEGRHSLVLNYTSCYLETSFPPIYAGLPAHTINRDTYTALNEEYGDGALGVIVCDFITSELADAIIGRNFR